MLRKKVLAMATILVVDDTPDFRLFLVKLLGYRGHRILVILL